MLWTLILFINSSGSFSCFTVFYTSLTSHLIFLELFWFILPYASFRFWFFLFPEKKPNYLKALSNIVNKLPKQVQVTELPAVSLHQTTPCSFLWTEKHSVTKSWLACSQTLLKFLHPSSSCLCCWRRCCVPIRASSSPHCPAWSLCLWSLHQLSYSSWRLCSPGCWHSPPALPWWVSHRMSSMNVFNSWLKEGTFVKALKNTIIYFKSRSMVNCLSTREQQQRLASFLVCIYHPFVAQWTWVFILVISFVYCRSLHLSAEMPVSIRNHAAPWHVSTFMYLDVCHHLELLCFLPEHKDCFTALHQCHFPLPRTRGKRF